MNVLFSLKNGVQVMLRADDQNYELCRPGQRKNKETGEVVGEWVAYKWFASLDQALRRLVDMKLRTCDARSIEELRIELAAARAEVTAAWSTAVKAADIV